jgi:hypothetical protein
MTVIRYARGNTKFDAHPVLREAPDFETFAAAVLADVSPAKGLAYVCGPLRVNGDGRPHRCAADAEPRRWLPFDVDGCADAETFVELRLWFARFRGFGYETASSTPERPRARIIVELDREADREECERLGERIAADVAEEFGDAVKFDPSVYRTEQPVFTPVRECRSFRLDGEPVNVEAVLASAPPRAKPADAEPAAGERLDAEELARAVIEATPGAIYDALLKLTAHYAGAGWKRPAIIELAALLVRAGRLPAIDPKTAEERLRQLPKMVDSALAKFAPVGDPDASTPLLGPVHTAAELLARPATPTRWLVEGWLAEGASALLGAHGGTGKSWLGLQLGACLATGRPFLGLPTARRRVAFYSCEDREDVLRWRLGRIAAALGITAEELGGNLVLIDQTRRPAELLGRDKFGALGFAPLYGALADTLKARAIEALVVDAASDAFGGNEIVRAEVRRYITEAQRLVPDHGAVAHVAHVDKAHARGLATGQGYSGSTAWHNSVRCRWELSRPVEDDDGGRRRPDPADPRRTLLLAKSNYGPAGIELALRFDDQAGIFEVEPGEPSGIVGDIARRTAEREVLQFLAAAESSGRPVHSGERANANLHRRMLAEDRLPRRFASPRGRRALFDMLLRWQADGWIAERVSTSSSRHGVSAWTVTPAGLAELARDA